MRGQHAVQRSKERAPAPFEMLPRVFAVENDRDGGLFPAARIRKAPSRLHEAMDEVRSGRFGLPAGVHEADQIGQGMVTEQARDLL